MLPWCCQSFQNNNICLPNGFGSLVNGEICYDASMRVEQKRGHQWIADASEQDLFFNKKQAIGSVNETSGPAVIDGSLWRDGSSSQSAGQTGDRLLSPKPVKSLNVSDKNIPSIISSAMNMEKKGFQNQFGNDSSICLTMSHAVEDPLCANAGLRKVKVNEVRMSENCLPEFVGSSFCIGDKDKGISSTFQRIGNNMFLGPTYNTADGNAIPMDPAFGQAFSRGNYNINTVEGQYEKESGNFMSIGPTHNKGHESFFVMDPFYNRANETFVTAGSTYKGDTNIALRSQQDATVVSLGALYNKENSSILPMVENFRKGEQTTISFGGFEDNPKRDHSSQLISYNALLDQSSGQSSGALVQKDSGDQLSVNVLSAGTSRTDGAHKNKEQKTTKGSSNDFPSNVKSLLSTGILDGVPVKYVSWSREKNLRGVVKGTGYLCSCQDCKLNKVINAYEFEHHAGCKTKHPNNNIYFENGKTIYAVVQELKSTPQDKLFEVMQNVAGSSVNQKNFNTLEM
ncbi:UNVERIFIED_CONTAM: hypothetical protein Sangu_2874300 [Sesamum angustifolium]|uniref:Tify domain-containing protein n=1 Tax=Sesamum angustifolium TaxID=2727405 RepID=A0AAW2INV0_9LAMI